jgi:micrococcal nuclease
MSHELYVYWVRLLKVVDGDTIDVMVDLGFRTFVGARLRLAGIDTAELNSTDPEKRKLAQEAKIYLLSRLPEEFVIKTYLDRSDKYGRMLAEVWVGDSMVNEELVQAGLAQVYG